MGWKMRLCKWHTFWMVLYLICYIIVILFFSGRKWLFMRNLATYPWKTLYETQTVSLLKEIIQPPPPTPPSDKTLLRLWNKNFLTKIYRNKQTCAVKVLQECGSWASRNGEVQMFFLATNRNMCAGKFAVWKVFGCVAGAYEFQCQVSSGS